MHDQDHRLIASQNETIKRVPALSSPHAGALLPGTQFLRVAECRGG